MSADRCKFLGGRSATILAVLCCASVSGSPAFAEQLRIDAGPCSPDGDAAAQRARVSKILDRLAEKTQFVAVIRDPACSNQHRIVLDVTVLSSGGRDQPPLPLTSLPDQEGQAVYLRAHGFSEEQQGMSQ
jgi:hypothetical protein